MVKNNRNKAILLGVISSIFFAATFVVNRLMSTEGGGWIWSASLRFYWMLPFFAAIVLYRKNIRQLIDEIKDNWIQWFLWSTVGFGFFYAPLTYAAGFIPSWLVASTWQVTIIAGIILAPWINKNQEVTSRKVFLFSGIILLGIVIMQVNELKLLSGNDLFIGAIWVIIAAFAYPLGNRKMMQITNGRLDVYQRILGMIICSMPFWVLLNIYGLFNEQPMPSDGQYAHTLIIALFSGLIATVLFFSATDLVRSEPKALAGVEATQSTEVLFALIGEIWILESPLPDFYTLIGIVLLMTGMILHSLKS